MVPQVVTLNGKEERAGGGGGGGVLPTAIESNTIRITAPSPVFLDTKPAFLSCFSDLDSEEEIKGRWRKGEGEGEGGERERGRGESE